MQKVDEQFMQRALDLADLGKNEVSPNPRVGAVIVHEGKIIGEGYHQKYGESHAEVNAIAAVEDKSLLKEATIYVSLEPCSHFGKTPPCADLILTHKIPRVVIANKDPFKEVAGRGIQKLQEAGVEVIVGVLQEKGERLNRRFFTFHQKQRPYIILKWAQTKDGFIGRSKDDPNVEDSWITNTISKLLVHLWRAEEDAILVGKNTVLRDNPELTCREVKGKNPIRLLIDSNCELEKGLKIFNSAAETVILNSQKTESNQNISWVKSDLNELVLAVNQLCLQRNIHSLIVEGGASILHQFITSGNWDEARVFEGGKRFKRGVEAPLINGEVISEEKIDGDILRIYTNTHS